ncbi:MAG: SulP family inorganic anion transporter [bacterium]
MDLTRIQRIFPIAGRLGGYGSGDLGGDAVAGLTVGILVVPQGMAYALLAGVPPIYGLYAALVPLLVYPLLGTSRHLAVGPVALDMLILAAGLGAIAEAGTPRYVALALLVTLLVGLFQILLGGLRLGFLAAFLSRPVISGFTSAAGLIIAVTQLGPLVGVDLPGGPGLSVLAAIPPLLSEVHLPSLALGLSGLAVLWALDRWRPLWPGALVVVGSGMLAAALVDLAGRGVVLLGDVPGGLPVPALKEVSLGDVSAVLPTVLTLGLIQFLNVVALGKVFAVKHRYAVSPNRELVAVGAANVAGSLFRSLPISGSYSRTAINDRAGARTALSNVAAAGVVGLTLAFATPLFRFVPLPALAAVIVHAGISLIDPSELKGLLRLKPRDGALALLTLTATLVIGIQEGILLGVGASMVAIIYQMSRPHVAELGLLPGTTFYRDRARNPEALPLEDFLILRVDASYAFPNADYLKEVILDRARRRRGGIRAVILDGSSINDLDTTALEALQTVEEDLADEGTELHLAGIIGPVRDVLKRSVLYARLGPAHLHLSVHRAVKYVLAEWDMQEDTDRLGEYRAFTEEVAGSE